jgi:ribosomal protein L30E
MAGRDDAPRPPADPRAEKVLGLLGLARRAGRLAMGATAVEKLVRHGRPPVVIIARDAGENQRRRFASLGPIRGLVDELVGREDLAERLGRSELVVVAVNDPGFVRGLIELGVVAEPRDGSAAS